MAAYIRARGRAHESAPKVWRNANSRANQIEDVQRKYLITGSLDGGSMSGSGGGSGESGGLSEMLEEYMKKYLGGGGGGTSGNSGYGAPVFNPQSLYVPGNTALPQLSSGSLSSVLERILGYGGNGTSGPFGVPSYSPF